MTPPWQNFCCLCFVCSLIVVSFLPSPSSSFPFLFIPFSSSSSSFPLSLSLPFTPLLPSQAHQNHNQYAQEEYQQQQQLQYQQQHQQGQQREKQELQQTKLKLKPSLDAYDLTATLSSAANDMGVSISAFKRTFHKLLKAYKRQRQSPSPPPSSPSSSGTTNTTEPGQMATGSKVTGNGEGKREEKRKQPKVPLAAHTAYLRGLYWRGAFEDARVWWEAEVWGKSVWVPSPSPSISPNEGVGMRNSSNEGTRKSSNERPRKEKGKRGYVEELRYVLDVKAVTIGVQVLIRCGKVKEAVELLERVAWKPAAATIRLFKMSFNAVSIHPTLNEPILASYLAKILMDSFPLAAKATKPTHYFHLLRALFRAIGVGGGRFELLYNAVLPLLPEMLESLNRQLLSSDGPTCVVATASHGKVRVRVHLGVVEAMDMTDLILSRTSYPFKDEADPCNTRDNHCDRKEKQQSCSPV
ncbi:hypothetical protein NMY22_g12695 [Coprinellus aureogranulatus]|nr:hypothetical protein NMY22_g12695 [Coprinellus aureogranulatus]